MVRPILQPILRRLPSTPHATAPAASTPATARAGCPRPRPPPHNHDHGLNRSASSAIYAHDFNLVRLRLRDGRHLAYCESGVPRDQARFAVVFSHGFTGSQEDSVSASQEQQPPPRPDEVASSLALRASRNSEDERRRRKISSLRRKAIHAFKKRGRRHIDFGFLPAAISIED
ncbi:hypothetical protein ZEAMMB73_Zm00001d021029, partial [Zea mays]